MSVPGALANAVADALAPLGIELNALPVHGNVLHDLLSEMSDQASGKGEQGGEKSQKEGVEPWH